MGNNRRAQTQEPRHCNFFKPCFKREIPQSHPFYCEQATGEGYYLMNRRIKNRSLWIKLSSEVLEVKNPHEKKTLGVVLEVYEATPVFIPVDIT